MHRHHAPRHRHITVTSFTLGGRLSINAMSHRQRDVTVTAPSPSPRHRNVTITGFIRGGRLSTLRPVVTAMSPSPHGDRHHHRSITITASLWRHLHRTVTISPSPSLCPVVTATSPSSHCHHHCTVSITVSPLRVRHRHQLHPRREALNAVSHRHCSVTVTAPSASPRHCGVTSFTLGGGLSMLPLIVTATRCHRTEAAPSPPPHPHHHRATCTTASPVAAVTSPSPRHHHHCTITIPPSPRRHRHQLHPRWEALNAVSCRQGDATYRHSRGCTVTTTAQSPSPCPASLQRRCGVITAPLYHHCTVTITMSPRCHRDVTVTALSPPPQRHHHRVAASPHLAIISASHHLPHHTAR